MKLLLIIIVAALCLAAFQTYNSPVLVLQKNEKDSTASPKIQVAILLDVSNSMDGLIDQAKAQLWNMVNTVGKAKCGDKVPEVEIALYEYGRTTNNPLQGYVKQVSPFTKDLDQLSEYLFQLKTDGGDEYCSHVIYSSLKQLNWDTAASTYKVIFIAGNEDFNQGAITWTAACQEARKKGVIVNTIYCGDKQTGISEHWNLAGECGNGSFTNINQDAKAEDINTPYDSALFALNGKLNGTYISYGYQGEEKAIKQNEMDKANFSVSKEVMAKRISVKGKKDLYKNEQWDLVDASVADSTVLEKIELKTLPPALKDKSRTEIKKIVQEKTRDRSNVQKEIAHLSTEREKYILTARKAKAGKAEVTLESEIERILKQQVRLFNMVIE